jgi:hypothetical protein
MGLGSGTRDPRSGIRKKPIPDSGSRIQVQGSKRHRIPDPGSGSATLKKKNKEDHTNLALPHHTERRQTKGAERETVGM